MVPHLTDLGEEILREFHCSRFTVHPGGTKMYQDLRHLYYWSGMKRHVGYFVRRCLTCQQVKAEHQKPAGLLQPLEGGENCNNPSQRHNYSCMHSCTKTYMHTIDMYLS